MVGNNKKSDPLKPNATDSSDKPKRRIEEPKQKMENPVTAVTKNPAPNKTSTAGSSTQQRKNGDIKPNSHKSNVADSKAGQRKREEPRERSKSPVRILKDSVDHQDPSITESDTDDDLIITQVIDNRPKAPQKINIKKEKIIHRGAAESSARPHAATQQPRASSSAADPGQERSRPVWHIPYDQWVVDLDLSDG